MCFSTANLTFLLCLSLLENAVRLLPFLGTTMKSQHRMKGRLLLNVVVKVWHLPAAYQQEAALANQEEFPPKPGSWFLHLSIASEGSTSRVMVFPIRVFMKICMLVVFHHRWSAGKPKTCFLYKSNWPWYFEIVT